jgi:hypothetical protein
MFAAMKSTISRTQTIYKLARLTHVALTPRAQRHFVAKVVRLHLGFVMLQ